MKTGICGSAESNDCLITVNSGDIKGRQIKINSLVGDFFYDNIYKVIIDTLDELNIENIEVICIDKGALDYAIKARLAVAIKRMEENNA